MSDTTPLVRYPSSDAPTLSTLSTWKALREEAADLLRSGYLPAHIKTPEQAVTIAAVGRELGLSPWRALSGIKVVQGTPTLSSELMAQLIYQNHGPDALVVEDTSTDACTISYQRRGAKERKSHTYTLKMAEQAGLISTNANYKKHPANMLRARCISNIARMAFPDTIAGCYSEDEQDEIIRSGSGGGRGEVSERKGSHVLRSDPSPAPPRPSLPPGDADASGPIVAEMRAEITQLAADKLAMDLKEVGWAALASHLATAVNAHVSVPTSKGEITDGWLVQVLETLRTLPVTAPETTVTDDALTIAAPSDDGLPF